VLSQAIEYLLDKMKSDVNQQLSEPPTALKCSSGHFEVSPSPSETPDPVMPSIAGGVSEGATEGETGEVTEGETADLDDFDMCL
jgi:hypothetical protein